MPQCCRCNGSGRCANCVCVRNNRTCTNCTPAKNGCCENQLPSLDPDPTQPPQPQPTQTQSSTSEDEATTTDSQQASQTHVPPPFLLDTESAPDDQNPNHVSDNTGLQARLQDTQMAEPNFQWGEKDGKTFCTSISSAYSEVVHWRRNIFMIPSGKTGKAFIRELASLYQAYADATALECVALKACTVMQCLLLQKPHAKSKAKEHAVHLERRLKLWREGNVEALVHEGRCIQKHLNLSGNQTSDSEKTARIFSRLMLQGKVNAALRLLSRCENGGVLSLDDLIPTGNEETIQRTTRDVLLDITP